MKQLKDLKLKEYSKLNALDKKGLNEEITLSMKNLFVLRMKKEKWELKNTHIIKFLRRYIARVKTIANMKVD